jgi:hypothetical protein
VWSELVRVHFGTTLNWPAPFFPITREPQSRGLNGSLNSLLSIPYSLFSKRRAAWSGSCTSLRLYATTFNAFFLCCVFTLSSHESYDAKQRDDQPSLLLGCWFRLDLPKLLRRRERTGIQVVVANDRLAVARLDSRICEGLERPDVHRNESVSANVVRELELFSNGLEIPVSVHSLSLSWKLST